MSCRPPCLQSVGSSLPQAALTGMLDMACQTIQAAAEALCRLRPAGDTMLSCALGKQEAAKGAAVHAGVPFDKVASYRLSSTAGCLSRFRSKILQQYGPTPLLTASVAAKKPQSVR